MKGKERGERFVRDIMGNDNLVVWVGQINEQVGNACDWAATIGMRKVGPWKYVVSYLR